MWTDRYSLIDENGTELENKMNVGHIKAYLDDMKPEPGRTFTVKSEVTGYTLKVTDQTKQEEWREFADKCLRALD